MIHLLQRHVVEHCQQSFLIDSAKLLIGFANIISFQTANRNFTMSEVIREIHLRWAFGNIDVYKLRQSNQQISSSHHAPSITEKTGVKSLHTRNRKKFYTTHTSSGTKQIPSAELLLNELYVNKRAKDALRHCLTNVRRFCFTHANIFNWKGKAFYCVKSVKKLEDVYKNQKDV